MLKQQLYRLTKVEKWKSITGPFKCCAIYQGNSGISIVIWYQQSAFLESIYVFKCLPRDSSGCKSLMWNWMNNGLIDLFIWDCVGGSIIYLDPFRCVWDKSASVLKWLI